MGERIEALARSVSLERKAARASSTAARALPSSALARCNVASAVSNSVGAGTFPPLSLATCRSRLRLALASLTVAMVCNTLASAEASEALLLAMASWSLAISRRAITCPFLTRSL